SSARYTPSSPTKTRDVGSRKEPASCRTPGSAGPAGLTRPGRPARRSAPRRRRRPWLGASPRTGRGTGSRTSGAGPRCRRRRPPGPPRSCCRSRRPGRRSWGPTLVSPGGASATTQTAPTRAVGRVTGSMAADLPPRGRTPLARLLTLLGLTGFAISQPLLAVAGEDPTLFTFAGVDGSGLVALALLVAFVPPVVAWLVVLLLDRLHPRAGQAAHLVLVALLAGAAAAQWAWAAGLDHRTARMGAGLLAGVALAALVV